MFATLVPDFPSPYQGMGLTALAALTPDTTVNIQGFLWLLLDINVLIKFGKYELFPFIGWSRQPCRDMSPDPSSEWWAMEKSWNGFDPDFSWRLAWADGFPSPADWVERRCQGRATEGLLQFFVRQVWLTPITFITCIWLLELRKNVDFWQQWPLRLI